MPGKHECLNLHMHTHVRTHMHAVTQKLMSESKHVLHAIKHLANGEKKEKFIFHWKLIKDLKAIILENKSKIH